MLTEQVRSSPEGFDLSGSQSNEGKKSIGSHSYQKELKVFKTRDLKTYIYYYNSKIKLEIKLHAHPLTRAKVAARPNVHPFVSTSL